MSNKNYAREKVCTICKKTFIVYHSNTRYCSEECKIQGHRMVNAMSGYYDMTAYKAIKNLEGECGKVEVKRGEIWEIELTNGMLKKALVISGEKRSNDRWQSIVVLNEDQKGKNTVEIVAEGMLYADCDRVSYAESKQFNRFVKLATDEEMHRIDEKMLVAIGLDSGFNNLLAVIDDRNEEIAKLMHRNCVLDDKLQAIEKQILASPVEVEKELLKAETQRDMYKELYEQMLEKMIG